MSKLFDLYDSTTRQLLDALLPVREVKIRHKPLSPWFDAECRTFRRGVRKCERKFRRTKNPDDRRETVRMTRDMHKFFRDKERNYWESQISRNARSSRKLWKTFNDILGRTKTSNSQLNTDLPFTANQFVDYLLSKVRRVRDATAGSQPPEFTTTDACLQDFEEVTLDVLRRVILSMPMKSCELDPIPTFIVHDYIDYFLPFLMLLCNRSLKEGCLPASQKLAIVKPRLKQTGLDESEMSNYRPISNLSFLSKVLEKVVTVQLLPYFEANDLLPKYQSGFRASHSTEMLLMHLLSNIYRAIDGPKSLF